MERLAHMVGLVTRGGSSAADRVAFGQELADVVAALVHKYHDETADGGREHRLIVAVNPSVTSAAARIE